MKLLEPARESLPVFVRLFVTKRGSEFNYKGDGIGKYMES